MRRLGKTNYEISPIGLGTWQFSQGSGLIGSYFSTISEADMDAIVKMSLDGGINWFDTAEAYGKGKSEEALAGALNRLGIKEEEALIATKWWPLLRTAGSITGTIQKRKDALKGRRIDLHQVHQPFSFSSPEKEMKQMASLVKEGHIGAVGVSNFNRDKMDRAIQELNRHGASLTSNQMKYSLLDRRIETNGVLDLAKQNGVTIIAYSPLEQGILTGKFHDNPDLAANLSGPRKHMSQFKPQGLARTLPLINVLKEIGNAYGIGAGQVALNWLVHFHGDTVVAIPGASKLKHAEDNVKVLGFKLTQDEMKKIDEESRKVAKM
ncbi:aldo/keto reductase [Alkalihalobacillus hwajinpoensis]|uniref:aldo/keto reductase n=1 Tax=Guptibacillus hwajinpoensis TaxID=208199 RepID=UPI0018839683|nr:aldo/keto reductase [Pseudalkalibacillus hwajinpoensis]MBF0707501.1 aldo/keto reductase [Pseudalkalibacillus hwajinpoensis]